MVITDLSLWTSLLTEEARRQACCIGGSTEHSLPWCPSPFQNDFFPLNLEFAISVARALSVDNTVMSSQRVRKWPLTPIHLFKVMVLGLRLLPV